MTPEPISDELREKLRIDLRKEWYSSRLCPYFRRMTQANWVLYDHCRTVLDSEFGEIDTQRKAYLFCNRPSGFYWSRDPLEAGIPSRRRTSPNTIFASVFSEWHRLYDDQPNDDFGHFVANPIRVTEGGPDTIRGIIKAHISLYTEAKGILCGEIHRPGSDVNSSPLTGDFSIHPLYPALVLICDRDKLAEVYLDYKRPDGYVRLRDFMHLQSVIIARTGREHMLSQPIAFESLQSKALPLDRADFDGRANVDVIRVRLPDAIRFVVDLEKREDAFIFQESGSKKNPVPFGVSLDRKLHYQCFGKFCPKGGSCDDQQQWADQHIAAGEEHGYKHCSYLVEALRRVQAEMKNETYTTLAPMWFGAKMVDYEGELGAQL